MPTIARFYGMIIRMYFAPKEHPPPHIHVYYKEHKAIIGVRDGEMTAGYLPPKQARQVRLWVERHQQALLANWERVMEGQTPSRIAPLE